MSRIFHLDRRSKTLKDGIVQGEKYKVYLATCAVYTKNNQYVKTLENEVIVHIENNRELYYKTRKNRNGHKKLDQLIENPEPFLEELREAIKIEEDIQEEEHLDEVLGKLPY